MFIELHQTWPWFQIPDVLLKLPYFTNTQIYLSAALKPVSSRKLYEYTFSSAHDYFDARASSLCSSRAASVDLKSNSIHRT